MNHCNNWSWVANLMVLQALPQHHSQTWLMYSSKFLVGVKRNLWYLTVCTYKHYCYPARILYRSFAKQHPRQLHNSVPDSSLQLYITDVLAASLSTAGVFPHQFPTVEDHSSMASAIARWFSGSWPIILPITSSPLSRENMCNYFNHQEWANHTTWPMATEAMVWEYMT